MEIVLCKLTLQELDSQLESYLKTHLPAAQVVVAKCIGCCGDCSNSYVVLKNGQLVRENSREALLKTLKA